MPMYEYRCDECGHQLEAIQKFSDPPLTECPSCGASALNKLLSQSSFALKGGGWYADGYGPGGEKAETSSSADGASSSDSQTDTKASDSKTSSDSKANSDSKPSSDSKANSDSKASSDSKSSDKKPAAKASNE